MDAATYDDLLSGTQRNATTVVVTWRPLEERPHVGLHHLLGPLFLEDSDPVVWKTIWIFLVFFLARLCRRSPRGKMGTRNFEEGIFLDIQLASYVPLY